MRAEACQGCEHLDHSGFCRKKLAALRRIKGCSQSPVGRRFFRSKSGAEAFRVNVLGKRKEDEK